MRPLFVSERRAIEKVAVTRWPVAKTDSLAVQSEYIARPDRTTLPPFNCDFCLDFVDRRTITAEVEVCGRSILPGTLGAEVFVTAIKDTFEPVSVELLSGEAFGIGSYRRHIHEVEAAVRRAFCNGPGILAGVCASEIARHIAIRKSRWARVMVIGDNITFLYCPKSARPEMRGERLTPARDLQCEIDLYVEGNDIICIDGWVHHDIPRRTGGVIVSLPVQ